MPDGFEAFLRDWGDLGTYNAERARGIVHTPEMDAQMAEKQKRYDALEDERRRAEGWERIVGPEGEFKGWTRTWKITKRPTWRERLMWWRR